MDFSSFKTQIIMETNKFRLGSQLLKLQPLTDGSAIKITKIKGVNGAIVPALGSAPISLFDAESIIAFPLTLKLPILFSSENFEDNAMSHILQKSFKECFHFAGIENQLVIDTLLAGAGKAITAESHPKVREVPIFDNFLEAIKFIENNNYAPNKIVINPDIAESLRRRDELKEKLQTYAMEVIINTAVPSGTILILDNNHAGILLERVPIEVSEYVDHWKDQKGFMLRERVVPIVLNGNAIAKIIPGGNGG